MSLMSVYVVHTHTSQISTLNLQFSIFTAFTSEIPFLLTTIDKEVVHFAFSNAKTWAIFREFAFFIFLKYLCVPKYSNSRTVAHESIWTFTKTFMYTRNILLCVMAIILIIIVILIEYEINQRMYIEVTTH